MHLCIRNYDDVRNHSQFSCNALLRMQCNFRFTRLLYICFSSHRLFGSCQTIRSETRTKTFPTFLRINSLIYFNLFMVWISELCAVRQFALFCGIIRRCVHALHARDMYIREMAVNALISGRQLFSKIRISKYILITIIIIAMTTKTTKRQSFKKYVKTLACKCNQMAPFLKFVLLLKLLMAADALPSHLIRCSNWFCLVEWMLKRKTNKDAGGWPTSFVFAHRRSDFFLPGFDFNLNVLNLVHVRLPVDPIDSQAVVPTTNQKHMSRSALIPRQTTSRHTLMHGRCTYVLRETVKIRVMSTSPIYSMYFSSSCISKHDFSVSIEPEVGTVSNSRLRSSFFLRNYPFFKSFLVISISKTLFKKWNIDKLLQIDWDETIGWEFHMKFDASDTESGCVEGEDVYANAQPLQTTNQMRKII